MLHQYRSLECVLTTFQLQTVSTDVRIKVICFSPDKTRPLTEIKKYDFSQQYNNIVVTKHTTAQNHHTELNFHLDFVFFFFNQVKANAVATSWQQVLMQ